MKSILFPIFLFSLAVITIPYVFAEGGGGIDCPAIPGSYTYVNGSAAFEISPFDEDTFGILYCEFESFEENTVQNGVVNTMYHVGEELSQQLSDEYGCGESLGFEMSPLFVHSTTHFAVVTYSTSGLQYIAENVLAQIEQKNLATLCTEDPSSEHNTSEIDKETQEELEEIIKELDEAVEWIKEEDKEGYDEELGDQEGLLEELEIEQDIETELDIEFVLPDWIKDNSEWWASDQITDDDFLSGIEYLINEGIIVIPQTEVGSQTSEEIPSWIKFNAGWWADGQITDSEFIDGLQYLISRGIISVISI